MVRHLLVEEGPEGSIAREAELLDRPSRLAVLGSPLAWRILQELARSPDYPSALATRMKVHEQKVYYHVRRLEAAGLLRILREEPRQGASARILAPTAAAFAVVLRGKGMPIPMPNTAGSLALGGFLEEFSNAGVFAGSIVIGSPYPHGPFLTTARDSPYAMELGFFLGRLFAPPVEPLVRLDTEVKVTGLGNAHAILVGGPVANIITADVNHHLEVNFEWRQAWRVESSRTHRSYTDERVGLLAKVRSPWNRDRTVVVVSGLHHAGTHASILALTRFPDEVLDGYEPGTGFYRVVVGEDRDADGRLDHVAILE